MSWLRVNTPIELFWWHFNVVRKKHAERTPCLHSTGVHSFNTDTPERHPENTRDLVFKKGKGGWRWETQEMPVPSMNTQIFPLFLFQTLSPLGWWSLFCPSTALWTQSSTLWPPDLSRKWSISSGTITDKEGLWTERRLQRHSLPRSSGWKCGPCKRCPLNSWSQRFSQTPAICH